MGAFEYTALDAKGKEKKGVLEGDSPRQIRQQLREQGLTPLDLEAVQQREAKRSGGFGFRKGVSAAELCLVTRQLETLVRSGLPLEESLNACAKQSEKPRMKSMLSAIRAKVLEGHSLAMALGEFPHVFNNLFRATVEAGEQSGHLDVVLARLADYTESRQLLHQKISMALMYPVLVTIVAIAVVVGLVVYVVPQVIQVFDSTGQQLPMLTIALINSSDFLRDYGIYLLLFLVLLGFTVAYLLRQENIRFQFHRSLLGLPLIGRLVRGANTGRFARTFSILAASGVPVLDAMRISAQVVTNLPMREAVREASLRVREGGSIYQSLDKSGYFPPMIVQLIASGEASGKLEEMLERSADTQERELEMTVSSLVGLFEPLLILGMGGMVMLIVLAILMPIIDMNQMVH